MMAASYRQHCLTGGILPDPIQAATQGQGCAVRQIRLQFRMLCMLCAQTGTVCCIRATPAGMGCGSG